MEAAWRKTQGSELIPFLTVFNSEVGYGMSSALIAGHKHPHMPAVAAISDVRSDAGKALQCIQRLLQSLPLPATPVWDIDGAPFGHPKFKPAYRDSTDPRERAKTAPDPLRALLFKARIDQVKKPKPIVFRTEALRFRELEKRANAYKAKRIRPSK